MPELEVVRMRVRRGECKIEVEGPREYVETNVQQALDSWGGS